MSARTARLLFLAAPRHAVGLGSGGRRRVRSGSSRSTALLFVLVRVYEPRSRHVVYARSFYGVHKVSTSTTAAPGMSMHGTTIHGAERLLGDDGIAVSGRPERLTYYYQGGPLDEALSAARAQAGGRLPRVALVGLGVGALTCARLPGEDWSVYEIDPELVRLSVRSGLFRTMPTCAPDMRIVLGDARLTLTKEKQPFDVIILDAYSSDNVPVHLLTQEAMELYRSLLSPHGVILMNISNRNIELAEVVAASAAAADLKMVSKFDPSDPQFNTAFHPPADGRGARAGRERLRRPRSGARLEVRAGRPGF